MSNIVVTQGEHAVSSSQDAVLSCILGSCTAACLFDAEVGIGGMNHIVLPDIDSAGTMAKIQGTHAMEVLINELLKNGASRKRIKAKIFGGAQIIAGLTDVGARNAKFLRDFLAREDIPCLGESLGGRRGRRVQFWPATGRARQQFLQDFEETVTISSQKPKPSTGAVDLF